MKWKTSHILINPQMLSYRERESVENLQHFCSQNEVNEAVASQVSSQDAVRACTPLHPSLIS